MLKLSAGFKAGRNGFVRSLLIPSSTVSLGWPAERSLATDSKTTIPQPPKEQVQKRVEDLRDYNQKMKQLRKDLIAQGVSQQSVEAIRVQRIEEGKRKVGTKYTAEEKKEMWKKGQRKHQTYMKRFKKKHEIEERERILKQSIRRTKGDAFRAKLLADAEVELALDIEQTWSRSVREDLKPIVPVNAPFLGVLPKFHADVATIFGDDLYKVRMMYGPPKPLPPSENQYNGVDPRLVEYQRKPVSSPPGDWKPRKIRPSYKPPTEPSSS